MYVQHFANVLSRWAREHANEVGALEVRQKMHLFRSAFYTKGILRVYDYGIFFLLPIVIHRADGKTHNAKVGTPPSRV